MAQNDVTIEFHATAGAFFKSDHLISADDLERVFNLYLPFIGATSYALYHLLVNELPFTQDHVKRQDHNFIIDSLNISLPNFVKCRRRLEAAGLIRTVYEQDALGEVYGYRILTPLSADKFFKEQLLSGLLYKFVGEERYLTLENRYDVQGQAKLLGTDISARFLQVFQHQNDLSMPTTPLVYQEATINIDENNFKFDDFSAMIRGTKTSDIQKHRNFLVAMHMTYGVDEITLAGFVNQSVTLDTHEINEQEVQRLLRKRVTRKVAPETVSQQTELTQSQVDVPEIKNTEARALIEIASTTNAQDFLGYVKTTLKNGLVLKNERDLVDYLIAQSALSMAVVNILVHYVLIGLQNDSLKAALVTTIADSWTQNRVDSPEKALIQIQQRQKANQARQEKRFSRGQKSEKTTPKFIKSADNTPKPTVKISPENGETAAVLAKLKNIKTKN
ncbi:replication initiation and membrane attachment family protein [Leuconostoc sp. MS02]|uniref:Replication initiation and membrane attachment family protein n=1 Tax=Leuconostoc aquikimchii TaxID=3236804 RepID=A0ABV3S181_9LACO